MKTTYLASNTNFFTKEKQDLLLKSIKLLESQEFKVVCPDASHPMDEKYDWEQTMKNKLKAMLYCDCVMIMEGWEKCKDAQIVVELAMNLGIPVYRFASTTPLKAEQRIMVSIDGALLNIRL